MTQDALDDLLRLDRLKRQKRRGYAANSPDVDAPKLSLSILQSPGSENERIAWQDDEQGKVETRITEIAIQVILSAELQYRESAMRSYNGGCNARPNWKRKNGKGTAKRSGRNGNGRSGSNKPESTVCSRALLCFSRPEQSESMLKRFVRHRLTIPLAQEKSWNVGASGRWRKPRGLTLWSGVDFCWPCKTNSDRKMRVLIALGKTEGIPFVYGRSSNGKSGAARG
jgi:hypothetical protein